MHDCPKRQISTFFGIFRTAQPPSEPLHSKKLKKKKKKWFLQVRLPLNWVYPIFGFEFGFSDSHSDFRIQIRGQKTNLIFSSGVNESCFDQIFWNDTCERPILKRFQTFIFWFESSQVQFVDVNFAQFHVTMKFEGMIFQFVIGVKCFRTCAFYRTRKSINIFLVLFKKKNMMKMENHCNIFFFNIIITLFKNKRFMLDEMLQ